MKRASLKTTSSLLLSACLLLGCSSTPDSHFYLLTSKATQAAFDAKEVQVHVADLRLPSRILRPQLVWLEGPHELRLSEFDRWADPLEESIPRVLTENLVTLLGHEKVSNRRSVGADSAQITVVIEILRFEFGDDLSCWIEARWRLERPDAAPTALRRSHHFSKARGKETRKRVEAMSVCLHNLSKDIAKEIARLSAP